MKVGVFVESSRSLNTVRKEARAAEEDGFHSFWVNQVFNLDALTTLAVVAGDTSRIQLGAGAVPIQPRHPQMLAGQALTVQAASDGRLTLAIGLSHQLVVEHMWGMQWERPVARMREYLAALDPMLAGEAADVRGQTVTAIGSTTIKGATKPKVLVAALGPQMLRVAGERADGALAWCTGGRTLASLTVPTVLDAAAAAGRPEPEIVANLPICITDDPKGARHHIASILSVYATLPSYRRALDQEGVDGPADIAVVGDEDHAFECVDALRSAGVTEFVAAEMFRDPDERARTRRFLRSLL